MNDPVTALVVGLLVMLCVAGVAMLTSTRKGDASTTRLAFWIVIGVIVILVAMFATPILSGGSED